jgi:putative ABC transport system permease protein
MQWSENWGSIEIRATHKIFLPSSTLLKANGKSMVPAQPLIILYGCDFSKIYTAEQQTGKLFITFAVFAIFIGCPWFCLDWLLMQQNNAPKKLVFAKYSEQV